MKSLLEYLNEGYAKNEKITATGKKKFDKVVSKWLGDIKSFMREYGFSREDDYYTEIENIVWNYVNDNGIVSMASNDEDTMSYLDDKIEKLSDAVENM